MTNFTYNENFFNSIEELLDYEGWDKEEIDEFPDDWEITCWETDEEPIHEFTKEDLFDAIDEERFPEDATQRFEARILEAIIKNVNFEQLNAALPKLWYETRKSFKLTKQDLLNELK